MEILASQERIGILPQLDLLSPEQVNMLCELSPFYQQLCPAYWPARAARLLGATPQQWATSSSIPEPMNDSLIRLEPARRYLALFNQCLPDAQETPLTVSCGRAVGSRANPNEIDRYLARGGNPGDVAYGLARVDNEGVDSQPRTPFQIWPLEALSQPTSSPTIWTPDPGLVNVSGQLIGSSGLPQELSASQLTYPNVGFPVPPTTQLPEWTIAEETQQEQPNPTLIIPDPSTIIFELMQRYPTANIAYAAIKGAGSAGRLEPQYNTANNLNVAAIAWEGAWEGSDPDAIRRLATTLGLAAAEVDALLLQRGLAGWSPLLGANWTREGSSRQWS